MFITGQRVRVSRYDVPCLNPKWGDPHFIVGHFGYVIGFDRHFIEVQISHGPNGGPVDRRVFDGDNEMGVWPMLAGELEPVD